MYDCERHIGRLRVARRLMSLVLGVFLVLLLPAVPADFVDATDLGDCFGGVLADDPLNCYILEQAQKWDVMDIEGLYHAKAAPLYVYLTGENNLNRRDARFLAQRGLKFAKSRPELAITDRHTKTYKGCGAYFFFSISIFDTDSTTWCLLNPLSEYDPLPYSPTYIHIRVRGADDDADGRGKSGLHKVWPMEVGPIQKFDIRDVNLVNLPAYVCLSDLELMSEGRSASAEIEIHPTPNYCHVRGRFDAEHLAIGIAVVDESRDHNLPADHQSTPDELIELARSTFQKSCMYEVAVCTKVWDEKTQKYETVATVEPGAPGGTVRLHGWLAEYADLVRFEPMRVADDLNDHLNEVLTLIADSAADETGAPQVDVELRTRGWDNWFGYALTEADSETERDEINRSPSPITGISKHYEVGGTNSTDTVKMVAFTETYKNVEPVTNLFSPTKYSDQDVYRWTNSLNAYAQSESNTVGILKASTVGTRNRWPRQAGYDEVAFKVDLCAKPEINDACAATNFVWSNVSKTIEIEAYDAELLIDALPELLPQLGIPHEAVRTVRKLNQRVEAPYAGIGWTSETPRPYPFPLLRRWANSVGVSRSVPYSSLLAASATLLILFFVGTISLLVVLTVEGFKLARCRCSDCFAPSTYVGNRSPPT